MKGVLIRGQQGVGVGPLMENEGFMKPLWKVSLLEGEGLVNRTLIGGELGF